MAAPPASLVRNKLRGRLSLVLGAGQLLWLPAAIAIALSLPQGIAISRGLLVAVLTAIAFVVSRMGARAVDRLLGPTLDRLSQVAEQASPVDPTSGLRLPSLIPDSPQSALRQLMDRLEEAQTGLSAKVEQLEAANRQLETAREELVRSERLALIGRLSAGIAHEVGNPLGALMGFVDLAKQTTDPALKSESLAGIEIQAQRIHRTVQELMDFARAGKMDLGPIALSSAIAAASRLVRAHPRWRSMVLSVEQSNEGLQVRASEHHLVQVLVNLFLNAADACQGSGTVRVSVETMGRAACVWITDSGPGIAPQDREKIFEPFFSTKPVGEGAGLGLAISRQLVERFGGELRAVESSEGARFQMSLVAAQV